ncbi:hypothetical protein GCM10010343_34500 [Streptomyces avidinii]|nr:hypothetical protein GCM10010343_34500 [Streptomyces avidinii]
MADAAAGMRSCPRPAGRGGRWLRAAVFTLLSSVLAVVGHHLTSEDPVSWRRATLGVLATFALSWRVSRRSLPGRYVLAATVLAQLLLHRALSLQRQPPGGHAEAHDGVLEIGHGAHHVAWPMAATHCVAACVMALLMHRADQVLSRVPERVARWARSAVAAAVAAFGAGRRPWFRPGLRVVGAVERSRLAVRPMVMTMLWHAVVRRGPPAGCAGDVPPILTCPSPAR